jgi:hypothetical protein
MDATEAAREMRKRRALKLFVYAITPAMAIVGFLLVWKELIGAVPDLVFYIAYGLALACVLVCLVAVVRFYVAHFDRTPDAT